MAHAEFARRVELLGQVRNDALVFRVDVGQRAKLARLGNDLCVVVRKLVEAR
jgi:hypothetical protein